MSKKFATGHVQRDGAHVCIRWEYTSGRIKKARKPAPKHRWPALTKRIGTYRTFLIVTFPSDIFNKALFGITRWNRH